MKGSYHGSSSGATPGGLTCPVSPTVVEMSEAHEGPTRGNLHRRLGLAERFHQRTSVRKFNAVNATGSMSVGTQLAYASNGRERGFKSLPMPEMGRIDEFLERRYVLGNRTDDDRFQDVAHERHASRIGKCQRQNWYKVNRDSDDTYSPYFELGNRFEDIYGAVLISKYDDSFDDEDISNMPNHELIAQSDMVIQDVNCLIKLGESNGEEVVITGEADWVVLYDDRKVPDEVVLNEDGSRTFTYEDGTEETFIDDEQTPIRLVIETKTSSIKWREKYGHKFEHEYQVGTYMWAFDARGEIVYMERDNLDELIFEFVRTQDRENDIAFRAKELHMKVLDDEPPDANPPRDGVCKYCSFRTECEVTGGSRWEDDFESIESQRRND